MIFRKNSTRELARLLRAIEEGQCVDAGLYCRLILPKVSRTFALTIRLLGAPVQEPVRIGYLLCRIADTFEDAQGLPVMVKTSLLDDFSQLVRSETNDPAILTRVKSAPLSDAEPEYEAFLARHPEIVLEEFRRLPERSQEIIRKTVLEMAAGMVETLRKQHEAAEAGTESGADLDRYCYYVAGTVGHLLTDLFREYSPWITKKLYRRLCVDREAFGTGLQLTNIIKDAVSDLRRNVSFIPRDLAAKYGIVPSAINRPEFRENARKVMTEMIVKAVENLNMALRYTILLPKTEPRMRLFYLLPIFLAIRTLLRAATDDALVTGNASVKISRAEVRRTLRSAAVMCFWDFAAVREYKRFLNRLEAILGVAVPLDMKILRFLPVARA